MKNKIYFNTQFQFTSLLVGMFFFAVSFSGISAQTLVCNGDSLFLNLSGQTGAVQWEMSNTGTSWIPIVGATNSSYHSLPTGAAWYRAKVTDGTCLPVYSDTTHIVMSVMPVANAGSDQTICEGGSVTIGGTPAASGGISPYTYMWSPATALSSASASNPAANPVLTTSYILTVTDSMGCTRRDTALITVNTAATPIITAGGPIAFCTGGSVNLSASNAVSYSWTPAGTTQSINVVSSGSYSVTVTYANGCSNTSVPTVVTVYPAVVANAGNDTTYLCAGPAPLGGSPAASGGTSPYTYSWNPATNLSSATVANPVCTPSGILTYTLTVTDSFNCTAQDITVASPGTGSSGSLIFAYTGAQQIFTVPACVTSVIVEVWGAQGQGGNGGNGGYAKGTMTVTPGQQLFVYVGGQNGFNGGGIGHANTPRNGGGASDFRSGGSAMVNRVIVAGGGGSSSGDSNYNGGTGGGGVCGINYCGGGGGVGYSSCGGGSGGNIGGTGCVATHAGGAGGGGFTSGGQPSCQSWSGSSCGTAGGFGIGGDGDIWENGICYSSYGGTSGGGGGYYGGGGSSTGNCGSGGGGGGSSWTGNLASPTFTPGNRTGDGQAKITW